MYFRCQILINGISYEATDDLKTGMILNLLIKEVIMTEYFVLLALNLSL